MAIIAILLCLITSALSGVSKKEIVLHTFPRGYINNKYILFSYAARGSFMTLPQCLSMTVLHLSLNMA